MNKIRDNIITKMKENKEMIITQKQEEEHNKAKHCCMCNGTFDPTIPANTR